MKMKPIAVGVCAMLMGVTAAHAGKIAGTDAHADGKVVIQGAQTVTLTLDNPEAEMQMDAADQTLITAVRVTPKSDSYVWVGYSDVAADNLHGIAKDAEGHTLGLWLSNAPGHFNGVSEGVAVSNKSVGAGETVIEDLRYAPVAGEVKTAGAYAYGLDAGLWTN